MCPHFYYRGQPGMDDHARTASQDTSMTSDLCNFVSEVAPSYDEFFTKAVRIVTGSRLRRVKITIDTASL